MAKLGMLKNIKSRTGTQDSRSVSLTVKDIPIGDIHVIRNVRKDYTEIYELAQSIRKYGLLQPITVYACNDGYAVKAGHRRLMAYKRLYQEDPEKFHSIRCIISDEQNTVLIQLVENIQRVDLSQHDLFLSLNQLREQGMPLKQIAEVIGKTEGYVKNLFVGVNELNRDKDLQSLIGHAGVTIGDIAETATVTDKGKRLELLEERKSGKVNRAGMREKVRELTTAAPKEVSHTPAERKSKADKTHIQIKAFPGMDKIIIYQVKGGSIDQLLSLEKDLIAYFSANKEKYRIEKTIPDKEDLLCADIP